MDVVRLTFDGLMILRLLKVCDVKAEEKNIKKTGATFIHDSFDEVSKAVLSDIRFLPDLLDFAENEKDNINDETCELLARIHASRLFN